MTRALSFTQILSGIALIALLSICAAILQRTGVNQMTAYAIVCGIYAFYVLDPYFRVKYRDRIKLEEELTSALEKVLQSHELAEQKANASERENAKLVMKLCDQKEAHEQEIKRIRSAQAQITEQYERISSELIEKTRAYNTQSSAIRAHEERIFALNKDLAAAKIAHEQAQDSVERLQAAAKDLQAQLSAANQRAQELQSQIDRSAKNSANARKRWEKAQDVEPIKD